MNEEIANDRYQAIRASVAAAGYAHDIEWAQNVKPPSSAEAFAREAIWVILCSGMKEQVARIIQERVWAAINAGKTVRGNVLGKSGKAHAIDCIWGFRNVFYQQFKSASDKVEYCATIPWIGKITKWHLAKNLGVDCCKPDIHLERLAINYGTTPAKLCAKLSKSSGDRIATVDVVLWRACNLGIINSRKLSNDAIDAAIRAARGEGK